MTYDVAVVGGGIVGCATAYYLARQGASVVVLERGRVGEGATGASAGMLAPVAEAEQPGPLLDLMVAALRDYPSAVREVEDASGLSTGYNQRSIMRVAFSAEDEAKFCNALPLYEKAGLPYHRLTGIEARREEPAVSEAVVSAILSPAEGQVLPRQLVQAFRRAAEARGAYVREGVEVTDITPTGVETLDGTISANTVVIASGAWSCRFAAGVGAPIPVRPVRGQIVAVKGLATAVRHVLYSFAGYAVPWPDGRLLLGATQEEAGFDARTTVEGVQQLLAAGQRLVPDVRHAEIDSVWAGLRPGISDGVPIIGRHADSNVWLATGHFRNGILLGPYTSRLIAESILAGQTHSELAPFSPARFHT